MLRRDDVSTEQATFEWKGRCGPFELALSDHTFPPASLSVMLAEVMSVDDGETVIDVGCGSGVLGIVAALLGAGEVIGIDKVPDTPQVATANAERLGVADRTRFLESDLFDGLPHDVQADLIIGDVSGVADPLARVSGWFPDGRGGGPRGIELPMQMVEQAPRWLKPGGRLLLPTGTIQDEARLLETARSLFRSVEQRNEKRFPLPQRIAEAPEVQQLREEGVVELTQRGSRLFWYGRVWECSLAPPSDPAS